MDKELVALFLILLVFVTAFCGALIRDNELKSDCRTKAMAAHYSVTDIQLICK